MYKILNHLLKNKTTLIGVRIAIPNISSEVINPKTAAAPFPAAKLADTMVNPLASAKLAMLQIRKNTITTADII